MKFMLMINGSEPIFRSYLKWSTEDLRTHTDFMHRFNRELRESGELVTTQGLAMPSEARLVRATSDGEPAVTDGPFAESKEFLAGYWIVDVERPEQALAIAARASAAPGPGGTPLNMPIEVRQVMCEPQVEL